MAPLFSNTASQAGGGGQSLSMMPSGLQRQQTADFVMDDMGGFNMGADRAAAAGGGRMVLNSQAIGNNFAATPSLMSMTTQQLMDAQMSQATQSEHLFYRAGGGGAGASQVLGSYQAFVASPQQRAIRRRIKGKQRVSIKSAHRVQVGGESVSLRFAGATSTRSNANKFRQRADLENRYARVWEARLAEESASAVSLFRAYRKGESVSRTCISQRSCSLFGPLLTDGVDSFLLLLLLFCCRAGCPTSRSRIANFCSRSSRCTRNPPWRAKCS
jgi:hypothetical protein